VKSLFTTFLHISDFVQTQNEAKILTALICSSLIFYYDRQEQTAADAVEPEAP